MLSFKIEKDENGFHVWCPELPGCHSHGVTSQIAMENLKDAMILYVEDVMEESLLNQEEELLVAA